MLWALFLLGAWDDMDGVDGMATMIGLVVFLAWGWVWFQMGVLRERRRREERPVVDAATDRGGTLAEREGNETRRLSWAEGV